MMGYLQEKGGNNSKKHKHPKKKQNKWGCIRNGQAQGESTSKCNLVCRTANHNWTDDAFPQATFLESREKGQQVKSPSPTPQPLFVVFKI